MQQLAALSEQGVPPLYLCHQVYGYVGWFGPFEEPHSDLALPHTLLCHCLDLCRTEPDDHDLMVSERAEKDVAAASPSKAGADIAVARVEEDIEVAALMQIEEGVVVFASARNRENSVLGQQVPVEEGTGAAAWGQIEEDVVGA